MENAKTVKGVGYNYKEILKQDANLFLLLVHRLSQIVKSLLFYLRPRSFIHMQASTIV